jgi:hypothetical protein
VNKLQLLPAVSWIRSLPLVKHVTILSTRLRLGLSGGLFPFVFSIHNLYAIPFSPIRATCPAYLNLHDLIILIALGEEYKSHSSSLCDNTFSHKCRLYSVRLCLCSRAMRGNVARNRWPLNAVFEVGT